MTQDEKYDIILTNIKRFHKLSGQLENLTATVFELKNNPSFLGLFLFSYSNLFSLMVE